MGTHPIFESDFDCLTDWQLSEHDGLDRVGSKWDKRSASESREKFQVQTFSNNIVVVVTVRHCRPRLVSRQNGQHFLFVHAKRWPKWTRPWRRTPTGHVKRQPTGQERHLHVLHHRQTEPNRYPTH